MKQRRKHVATNPLHGLVGMFCRTSHCIITPMVGANRIRSRRKQYTDIPMVGLSIARVIASGGAQTQEQLLLLLLLVLRMEGAAATTLQVKPQTRMQRCEGGTAPVPPQRVQPEAMMVIRQPWLRRPRNRGFGD